MMVIISTKRVFIILLRTLNVCSLWCLILEFEVRVLVPRGSCWSQSVSWATMTNSKFMWKLKNLDFRYLISKINRPKSDQKVQFLVMIRTAKILGRILTPCWYSVQLRLQVCRRRFKILDVHSEFKYYSGCQCDYSCRSQVFQKFMLPPIAISHVFHIIYDTEIVKDNLFRNISGWRFSYIT